MKFRSFLGCAAIAAVTVLTGCATGRQNVLVSSRSSAHPGPADACGDCCDTPAAAAVYEMRIYHPAPGKAEALNARFRNHTLKLFKKHGMENVAYFTPTAAGDDTLYYLLRYPSREAREASWKGFMADPAWQAAWKASEVNGSLVSKIESIFLQTTDYSPALRKGNVSGKGVFELRTYTTPAGRLANLDARFRDHTVKLFEKHGIHNWAYFHRTADQPEAATTLTYFVTHKSQDAAKASFAAFGQDPAWKAARAASEQAAGGSLTVPGGVKSVFLKPTDYSPTK